MIIIGLTGGIATGKSKAAAYLESLGAMHIDADDISRTLTASDVKTLALIRERFGDDVFSPDGTLNRKKMGDIVFRDEEKRKTLESIIHPTVIRKIKEEISSAKSKGIETVILNVPLLFESGLDSLCDEIWTMEAPFEVQVERIMDRGFTRTQAIERIRSQMSAKDRKARSHRVIDTDRPIEQTRRELGEIYTQICGETK